MRRRRCGGIDGSGCQDEKWRSVPPPARREVQEARQVGLHVVGRQAPHQVQRRLHPARRPSAVDLAVAGPRVIPASPGHAEWAAG